jgi:hypothetical protein
MLFQIDDTTRRKAKTPHELAMVNLLLFNLLILIALLAGAFLQEGSTLAAYRMAGIVAPLTVSLGIVAYTFVNAKKLSATGPWFAAAHWRLATGRHKILLISYVVGAAFVGLGWVLSQSQSDPRMEELMFVALQRVAIAPFLLSLMVLIMLESGALYQAGRGEVPDRIVKHLPPPADLAKTESAAQAGEASA